MRSDPDLIHTAAVLTAGQGRLYVSMAEDQEGVQDFPLGSRPPLVSGSEAEVTALSEIRNFFLFELITQWL